MQLRGTMQVVGLALVALLPVLSACRTYVYPDPNVALMRMRGRSVEIDALIDNADDTLRFRIHDGDIARDFGTRFKTGRDYTFAGIDGTLILLWGGIRGGFWDGMACADAATWRWRTVGHGALPKGFIPMCLYHNDDGELHMVGATWGETGCEAHFYDVAVRRGTCAVTAMALLGRGLNKAYYEVKATAHGVGVVLIDTLPDGESVVTYQRLWSGQWYGKFTLPVASKDVFAWKWGWDVSPDGSEVHILHGLVGDGPSWQKGHLSRYHDGEVVETTPYPGGPWPGGSTARSVGQLEVDGEGICRYSVLRLRWSRMPFDCTVRMDTVFYHLTPSGAVLDETFVVPLREGAFHHMRNGLTASCKAGEAPAVGLPWSSR